jgi:trimeric autotransporter adhesin
MPSTTTTTVSAAPPLSCSEAQAALLRAQQKVADAETALASAENKLAGILASTTTPTSGGSNTPSSTPTNTTPKASGTTITADQLVADEANVAAALADVNVANETLAQATIVSPIAGTVADVNVSAGTQVSADSSTANVVIVGRGGYEVTTTVTVADRPKVSVGDAATVTPDGSSVKLPGKVVSIGVATTSSSSSIGGSSSTTSYPVTIGFTSAPAGLRNGASSSVTIVVAHTDSALTVPTSAVTTIGTGLHTVTVLADGKTSAVSIQIGTIGTDRTAVTSGLTAGQTVVLADLGQAIPSSNTTNRFGGGGAFTGGGLGGGGFGGGGFGRGG